VRESTTSGRPAILALPHSRHAVPLRAPHICSRLTLQWQSALFLMYCLPLGWGWSTALLLGSIVSATDPIAVVALLQELGVSEKLGTMIEGESLLNDGSAFVIFEIVLQVGHPLTQGLAGRQY
jgi:Sodium/hydrogen exchanger family